MAAAKAGTALQSGGRLIKAPASGKKLAGKAFFRWLAP